MIWMVILATFVVSGASADLASSILRSEIQEVTTWEALLKVVSPDLLILDMDAKTSYDSSLSTIDAHFDSPSTFLLCHDPLIDANDNDTKLAEFLLRSLGPVPHDKRILVMCPLQKIISVLDKVSSTRLAKWQWRWIIVGGLDIVSSTLSNYTDEWRFALVEPYLFNGPASFSLPTAAGPNAYLIHSLHPTHNRRKPGFTRIPELFANIFPSDNAVIVESAVFQQGDSVDGLPFDEKLLAIFRESLFPHPLDLYQDLNGRVLTTTGNQYPPWFTVWNPECKTNPALECRPRTGIDLTLLGSISKVMNFSLRAVMTTDGEWGVRRADGSFTGMIGDISRKRADIASCEITISRLRRTAADFSYPYYLETLRFVTTAPVEVSRAFVVLKPFTPFVWLLVALTAALTVCILKLLQKAENWIRGPPITMIDNGVVKTARNWSATKYSIQVIQHLAGAGDPMPSHEAFKVYLIFWLLTALILAALYSGTLTAYMTFPVMTPTLNNLEELKLATSSGLLSWGLLKGTAQESLFKDAESGVYHDLWVNLVKVGEEKSKTSSVAEGVQRVADTDYAFVHGTLAMQQSMAEKGWSKFHLAQEGFFPNFYGIAMQKGSPLQPAFDRRILQLLSGGFLKKWSTDVIEGEIEKGLRAAQDEEGSVEDSEQALQLDHLQGAFIILFMGYGCSILAWIGEWVHYRKAISRCWGWMSKK